MVSVTLPDSLKILEDGVFELHFASNIVINKKLKIISKHAFLTALRLKVLLPNR